MRGGEVGRGALKTIVAFANTAGGTLLVGVEDKSRHVRGVRDPLDREERLANLISDHIVPDSCADRDGAFVHNPVGGWVAVQVPKSGEQGYLHFAHHTE